MKASADVRHCVSGYIEDSGVIKKIIDHLNATTSADTPMRPESRAPPQGVLRYVGPMVLCLLGVWLGRPAQLKDHRIIGWILTGLSVIVFVVANYA